MYSASEGPAADKQELLGPEVTCCYRMRLLTCLLLAGCLAVSLGLGLNRTHQASCDMGDSDRQDCGFMGVTQSDCEGKGCCWRPAQTTEKGKDTPWCFYPDGGGGGGDCDTFNWDASSPGFTDDFYTKMKANYRANLNVEGCGAVVAAPDGNTPGGSYYYHWMRDAGLSIKAWLDVNDNSHSAVAEVLDAYVGWVAKVQQKNDPNGIDVRVEPKFTIPDGEPYTGGWCRPQTDGPALRAMALSKYGQIQVKNNRESEARSDVWPLVAFDMEWVTEHWTQSGCDLWEEFTSDDFYWNRMAYVYSLNAAADFADSIGEGIGGSWRALAGQIAASASAHFNGEFIFEAHGREKDGAVIHAIVTFGEFLHAPSSSEAAKTVATFNRAFCTEYPINQELNGQGVPGILIGRYPGDTYAGGNPWQLLTAAHAELFYLGAQAAAERALGGETQLDADQEAWRSVLYLAPGASQAELARRSLGAGDSVMTRLWEHVKDDGGRIDEQIDKHSGAQTSAQALTWSYANILHALHLQKKVKLVVETACSLQQC